jgi:diguanylate cyclase (GGDEF)-like protein
MKILIAEDQATSALFLRRTLERMGHEVTVAVDGVEAWDLLEHTAPSVLISDWVMPRMDGLELCLKVRERHAHRYVYVILLTSKDRRQDRLDGLRAGADDFLTKPPDADELAVRLEIADRILAVHDALARQNALLADLATVDELTGVKNRRRFREDLALHFALATRQKTPLSLLMIDVDHFKQYNDAFGHPAGDDALRMVASAFKANTRDQDVVARYGGEEFVVLFPSTGESEVMLLAERLRFKIESSDWPLRTVTASIGAATTCPLITTTESLVEAADQALYQAKNRGRNQVCHHSHEESRRVLFK